MKIIMYVLIFVFALIIAAFLSLKATVEFFITRQLKSAFPGSEISLQGCVFRPTHLLGFSNIEIKKAKDYSFKIKDIKVEYGPGVFIKRSGLDISVKNLEVNLAAVSFNICGASFKLSEGIGAAQFAIDELKYNKVVSSDIKGKLRYKNNILFSEYLSAKLWDGQISGDLNVQLDKGPEYLLNLKLANLDIERFINDFDLAERFRMSGKIGGPISLKGQGANINILDGNLSTVDGGGNLIIKDNNFMQSTAQKTSQSVDLIVESFKDYHYNTGVVKLRADQGDIILNANFEGETGKRDLEIVLHSAIPKRRD